MKTILLTVLILFGAVISQAQSACDSLSYKASYSAFNDSTLSVRFVNESQDFFSGPSFYIIDNSQDTVAEQVFGSFGISGEQFIEMTMNAEKIGIRNFEGRLEIWLSQNDSLACSFNDTFDLCEIDSCIDLTPRVSNYGSATVDGSLQWNVFQLGTNLGSGEFRLSSPSLQSDSDTICLAPGKYRFDYAASTALGGQLYAELGTLVDESFISSAFSGFAGIIDLDLYKQCRPAANSVREIQHLDAYYSIEQYENLIYIKEASYPFELMISDMNGRKLKSLILNSAEDPMDISELSTGLYILQHNSDSRRIFKK